jgi:hypothetical protein
MWFFVVLDVMCKPNVRVKLFRGELLKSPVSNVLRRIFGPKRDDAIGEW